MIMIMVMMIIIILIIKKAGENFGKQWYVYSLSGDDAFELYTYPRSHWVVYIKYVQIFTCQFYLNKV